MKLIMDSRSRRIYLSDDGVTTVEVRAELKWFQTTLGSIAREDTDAARAVRAAAEKALVHKLRIWATDEGADLEIIGEPEVHYQDVTLQWHEDMTDEDGAPVPYFEPIPMVQVTAEMGYWPPAPEEAS